MNVLASNVVKSEIWAFALPLKTFSYDNVVLAFLGLRPDPIGKIVYLVYLTMS
jgi:hypothetical protein